MFAVMRAVLISLVWIRAFAADATIARGNVCLMFWLGRHRVGTVGHSMADPGALHPPTNPTSTRTHRENAIRQRKHSSQCIVSIRRTVLCILVYMLRNRLNQVDPAPAIPTSCDTPTAPNSLGTRYSRHGLSQQRSDTFPAMPRLSLPPDPPPLPILAVVASAGHVAGSAPVCQP